MPHLDFTELDSPLGEQMSGIRVVVVSDRRLSGLALAGALDSLPGTSVVGEVGQVADAKSCCERGEADAVLVDASVLVRTALSNHQTALAVPVAAAKPLSLEASVAGSLRDLRWGWSFDADRLETLTPREREVFVLLGTGLSNVHIGMRLGVTEATAKSHVGRILAKLNLESRLQAGLAAVAHATASPTATAGAAR